MSQDKQHPSEESPKRAPGASEPEYAYVSHNFDSMNRAIDTQIQKQELMSVIYRNQRYENSTRTIFYVVASLSIAALTAVLIWWLLGAGAPNFSSVTLFPQDQVALQTLSQQETIQGEDAPFIDTSFTVFHRNLTESGDTVVTGKTFTPNALAYPDEQYCYLESANSRGELAAKPLAAYEGSRFRMETEDPLLLKLAAQYCRFTTETP